MSPRGLPDVESFDPSRVTLIVFEDLMNMPKKIQEHIANYFSSRRHSNISPIYVSQRFFLIPKTVRKNATHISLHRGAGSLSDIKRIISQYTDQSENLASIIDNLTLKKEFIIFDLRRSEIDPLLIRVRWDTSIRSILDQSLTNPISIVNQSQTNMTSKFSLYGQKAIVQAKKD
ncbi:MAG TPA: ATPase/DNA packaging protein, partial [Nitrososphaeraceae archaeon]|nr:ATPase/DNA packaging protein [Nitrososphaeraceae archaeon]